MAEKIGVYICECGPNIKDAIDMDEVVKFAQGLDNVVLAKSVNLLCSHKCNELVLKEIKKQRLTRVVVAACSPKEHENTFRETVKAAGLNPFFLQIANIREQCAWIIKDKELATDKTKAVINAAVKRVVHHEPLKVKEIEYNPDVLVVGAGTAGISAALTLAQKKRKVYLIEKLPAIGGKAVLYEDLFLSLECASCVFDPKLDEILHNEHIELLTLSEIQEVLGFFSNFEIKVRKKARFVDTRTCIGCGACLEVCPVKVKNEYNEGLDKRGAIYIPYAGGLPHAAVIDDEHCLHFQGKECNACKEICPFGSINYKEQDRVLELKAGAIVVATGFDIFDPEKAPGYGYKSIENVYTGLEFERLLNSTGPTEGRIVLKNGQPPQKIVFIHCVGSKNRKFHENCSAVCCMYLLKFAHQAKQKLADVSITGLHSDLCFPGKGSQSFFNRVSRETGIQLLRMKQPDSVEISEQDGNILIKYTNIHGRFETLASDMVVLAAAIEGAKGSRAVAEVFDIALDEDGFFVEEHANTAPVSTARQGIFIAGCAQGPKDIQSSTAQGQAAAGMILSDLVPGGKLRLEPITAEVNQERCSGCRICLGLCPFKAITWDGKGKYVTINKILCRGCGICAAACPSGTIKAVHFTDREITEEIKGLLQTSSTTQ